MAELSPTPPPRRFYKPELDALRFFAFLGVFACHSLPNHADTFGGGRAAAWIAAASRAGAFGVDLFFVLSAYLITELLVRERETFGRLDVKRFYARRILRIWPLYFAFLAIMFTVVPLILPDQRPTSGELASYAGLSGNWWCAYVGYPASAIAPLWSVSIEEQFYLLWPPLVALLRPRALAAVAAGMLLVPTAVRAYLWATQGPHLDGRWLWTATPVRLEPIALGILLALAKGHHPRPRSIAARLGLAIAAVATIVAVTRYTPILDGSPTGLQAIVGYPAVALSCLALVLAFMDAPIDRLPRWLATALIELGKRSYGLYVIHVLAIALVREWILPGRAGNAAKVETVVLAFAIDVALSLASYRWLEAPFLRLKERFARVQSRPV